MDDDPYNFDIDLAENDGSTTKKLAHGSMSSLSISSEGSESRNETAEPPTTYTSKKKSTTKAPTKKNNALDKAKDFLSKYNNKKTPQSKPKKKVSSSDEDFDLSDSDSIEKLLQTKTKKVSTKPELIQDVANAPCEVAIPAVEEIVPKAISMATNAKTRSASGSDNDGSFDDFMAEGSSNESVKNLINTTSTNIKVPTASQNKTQSILNTSSSEGISEEDFEEESLIEEIQSPLKTNINPLENALSMSNISNISKKSNDVSFSENNYSTDFSNLEESKKSINLDSPIKDNRNKSSTVKLSIPDKADSNDEEDKVSNEDNPSVLAMESVEVNANDDIEYSTDFSDELVKRKLYNQGNTVEEKPISSDKSVSDNSIASESKSQCIDSGSGIAVIERSREEILPQKSSPGAYEVEQRQPQSDYGHEIDTVTKCRSSSDDVVLVLPKEATGRMNTEKQSLVFENNACIEKESRSVYPKVMIVRENSVDKKPEMKDAWTQFTGNHVNIQTDMVPEGMAGAVSTGKLCCRCHNRINEQVSADQRSCQASSPFPFKNNTTDSCMDGRSQVQVEENFSSNNEQMGMNNQHSVSDYSWDQYALSNIHRQHLKQIQAKLHSKRYQKNQILANSEKIYREYSTVAESKQYLSRHRPQKLELWQALMKLDPSLTQEQAMEEANG